MSIIGMARLGLVLALAAAGSAGAVQAADTGRYAGSTCGMTAVQQGDVLVLQPYFGPVTAAVTVTPRSGGSVLSVTVICTVQVNRSSHGGAGTGRSNTMSGSSSAVADTIDFFADPVDRVYLCTTYSWLTTQGAIYVQIDDDADASNGNTCAFAANVQTQNGTPAYEAVSRPVTGNA